MDNELAQTEEIEVDDSIFKKTRIFKNGTEADETVWGDVRFEKDVKKL